MLKLDGRTVRGRIWRDLQSSGKPLKQGVLMSKKLCSHCNGTPADFDKEVIECMTCHSHFHAPCLIQPVSEDFLVTVSSNPSIWWHCLACMSSKSNDGGIASVTEGNNCGSMTNAIMQNTLMTFKRDVLTLVGETMEKKLKTFADVINLNADGKNDQCSGTPQNVQLPPFTVQGTPQNVQLSQSPSTGTWADIAANKSSAESFNAPPSSHDVVKQQTPEKHVLLLEPLQPEMMSTDDAKKQSISSINDAITGVNVEFCSVRKSGIVAMGFKDSNAKKIALEKIRNNDHCSSSFLSRDPKKLVPKVTVTGINEVLFESCNKDNRDEMKAILLKDILDRNSSVNALIDSSENNFLTVVMIQKVMPNRDTVSYMAVLKMSSPVRKAIHDNGNKLYVSLNRCRVTDRYHVKQCYHCQKHGHISDDCPDKKEHKSPSCFYCSNDHRSKDCPDKKNLCCVNCVKSNNPAIIKGAKSHSAASSQCPILQSHVKNIQGKTEDWMEKNINC